jgi:hypothetical protein
VSGGQAVGAPSGYWSHAMIKKPVTIEVMTQYADWPCGTSQDYLNIWNDANIREDAGEDVSAQWEAMIAALRLGEVERRARA